MIFLCSNKIVIFNSLADPYIIILIVFCNKVLLLFNYIYGHKFVFYFVDGRIYILCDVGLRIESGERIADYWLWGI
jgi:hypothetical protein